MRYIIILYIRDNMRKSRVNKGGIGLLRKTVPHRIKAQSGLTWLIRLLLWCCAVWSVRKRNVRFGQAEMRRAHSLSSVRLSRKTTEMANNINWIYRESQLMLHVAHYVICSWKEKKWKTVIAVMASSSALKGGWKTPTGDLQCHV